MEKIFYRLVLLCLLIFPALQAIGQDSGFKGLWNGNTITINKGSSIYINGNLVNNNESGSSAEGWNIHNYGEITVTDSIINHYGNLFESSSLAKGTNSDGTESETTTETGGKVFMNSPYPQYIKAENGASITFSDLAFRDTLILLSSIGIIDTLKLDNWSDPSILFLNGNTIKMYDRDDASDKYSSGVIDGEDETRYIADYTDKPDVREHELGSIHMLKMVSAADNTSVNALKSMGIELGFGNGTQGWVSVTRKHLSQPVTSGSIRKYYTANVTNNIISDLAISYFEHDLLQPEETDSMKLFYSITGGVENSYTRIPSQTNYPGAKTVISTDRPGYADGVRYTVSSAQCPNPPKVTIGDYMELCEGSSFSVKPVVTNISYAFEDYSFYWNGSSQPDTVYTGVIAEHDMEISVLVIDPKGCQNTADLTIKSKPVPVARIEEIPQGEKLQCIDQTWTFRTDTIQQDVSYVWNYGDGTATGPEISVDYNNAGVFNVMLRATKDGCMATDTVSVEVEAIPIPEFITETVAEKQVRFIDQSQYFTQYDNIARWTVDGVESYDKQWVHQFSDFGQYDVLLVASNRKCSASLTETINVTEKGSLGFRIEQSALCQDDKLRFINESVCLWGEMLFKWDFGDGTYSEVNSPYKTYSGGQTQTYTVTLTAYDPNTGWSNTLVKNITVYEKPQINFHGEIYTCDNQWLLQPEGQGTSYLWNNGSTAPQLNVTQSGTYSLELTSEHGCVSKESVVITLNSPVIPTIGDNRSSCGTIILNAGNPQSAYLWSDGSTGQTLEVTQSGTYKVKVTQYNGCEGEKEVTITILPKPEVAITGPASLCEGSVATLQTPSQTGVSYSWSNGATGPAIEVAAGGQYRVRASNEYGCIAADSIYVISETTPVFSLGADRNVCLGEETILEMNDYYYASEIKWWDEYGNTGYDRTFAVRDTGTYYLRVTLPNGCSATEYIRFSGISTPLVNDFLMVSEANTGETVAFIDLSYPDVIERKWEIANSYTTTDDIFFYTFWNEGTYSIKLSVSNGGCTISQTKTITILNPMKSYVDGDNDSGVPPGNAGEIYVPDNEGLYQGVADIIRAIVYPNPTTGNFRLKIELGRSSRLLGRLYTVTGSLLDTFIIPQGDVEVEHECSYTGLSNGIYLLRLNTASSEFTVKVVITK